VPYIKQEERKAYDTILNPLIKIGIPNKGCAEYIIYKIMKIYMNDKEYRYSSLHDIVYAGIHASHEFERKHLDIRENRACEENGDIYALS
jgi:hypothetical protein